jgi:hypothetical protein
MDRSPRSSPPNSMTLLLSVSVALTGKTGLHAHHDAEHAKKYGSSAVFVGV